MPVATVKISVPTGLRSILVYTAWPSKILTVKLFFWQLSMAKAVVGFVGLKMRHLGAIIATRKRAFIFFLWRIKQIWVSWQVSSSFFHRDCDLCRNCPQHAIGLGLFEMCFSPPWFLSERALWRKRFDFKHCICERTASNLFRRAQCRVAFANCTAHLSRVFISLGSPSYVRITTSRLLQALSLPLFAYCSGFAPEHEYGESVDVIEAWKHTVWCW